VTNALAFHENFRGDDPMQSPAAVMTLRQLAGSKLRRSEDGQDLLEYGLLMALIAIFAIGAVSVLGNTIQNVFWSAIAGNF
jgi:Flp pilus assembly pilin Flp